MADKNITLRDPDTEDALYPKTKDSQVVLPDGTLDTKLANIINALNTLTSNEVALLAHLVRSDNPHSTTAAQVGAEPAFSILGIPKGGSGKSTAADAFQAFAGFANSAACRDVGAITQVLFDSTSSSYPYVGAVDTTITGVPVAGCHYKVFGIPIHQGLTYGTQLLIGMSGGSPGVAGRMWLRTGGSVWNAWAEIPVGFLSGARSMEGPLSITASGGVTSGNYASLSGSSNSGAALFGNNCYLDLTGNYRYKTTHPSLGARGILIPWASGGTPYYFNTGNIATTADAAFTPTIIPIIHEDYQSAHFFRRRSAAPVDLNNAISPGTYQIAAETSYVNCPPGSGWGWAILQVYSISDASYITQIITSLSTNNVFIRMRSETTWTPWRVLGGGGVKSIQKGYVAAISYTVPTGTVTWARHATWSAIDISKCICRVSGASTGVPSVPGGSGTVANIILTPWDGTTNRQGLFYDATGIVCVYQIVSTPQYGGNYNYEVIEY